MRKAEQLISDIRQWLDDDKLPPLQACSLLEAAESELRRLDKAVQRLKETNQ
tara:strand:- start:9554 stop:9709 length:156 start_codon:yes stop_codon:yes gene_type:complete